MAKQTSELTVIVTSVAVGKAAKRIAVTIVLVASLSYASCQRSSESGSQELRPRTSAVQIGEMAPNFTLEDQHNQKATLSSARGNVPSVLVFYRGYW